MVSPMAPVLVRGDAPALGIRVVVEGVGDVVGDMVVANDSVPSMDDEELRLDTHGPPPP